MFVDMSMNYLAWDNTQPVTLQSRQAAGGPKCAVAVAKRQAVTYRERSPSGGVYAGFETTWFLPAALVPAGRPPKPADVLTDSAGTVWTVLTAELQASSSTWELGTIDLVLANGLRDAVNVERAALTYDAAGVAQKAFPTGPAPNGGTVLYAALPARVQLLTDEVRDERGIRGFAGTHAVIVGQEVAVTNEDRVAFGGRYYDIVGYHNARRIDELPVLDVELRP